MAIVTRVALLALILLGGVVADGPAAEAPASRGACYCRERALLHCTANLTERDCHRQCDEAACDDWFWKDRLPCWNWGYGG